jgi:thimet oligopeptidase
MMKSVYHTGLITLGLFFLFAQIPAQEVKPAAANPFLIGPAQTIDFARVNPQNIREATLYIKRELRESNERIIHVKPGKRNFANTMIELDNGSNLINQLGGIYQVLLSASPDKAIRDSASAGFEETDNLNNEQSLNEDLYKAVKEYAGTAEAKALTGERKYFLMLTLRNFERNGFALSKEKRETLKALTKKLSELSLQFDNNIAQDNPTLILKEDEMEGLPDDFRKAHRQADGSYKMDVSNPSYIPFMNYAKSTEARKRVYLLKTNVAYPQNDLLLVEIFKLRSEYAKLLGHATFSEYATGTNMSKDRAHVWAFENQLKKDLRPKAEQEYKEMLSLKSQLSGKPETIILPYESSYYIHQLLDKKYSVDEEKVKEYFELQHVLKGLFEVYQRIYNLSFVEDKHPSVWNPDVQAFSVTDNVTKKKIGYFYLDLYPRDNKYKHAACFPMAAAHATAGGRSLAMASLICNFPKPGADKPSLMTHANVLTIFHEFGHLMHTMVSETELSYLAGTSVVRDFVEAPSQIMENWVWNKQVLSLFAKHYKTEAVIPAELVDKMIASRNATSGLNFLQQVYYGTLDFTYNDTVQPKTPDEANAVARNLQNGITLYPFVDGSHFESSFGHLTGYGAGYYGYLWSLVYACDMYSVFAADPLSPDLGHRFREMVLAKGGSDDALNLVRNFLGREPTNAAFLKNMGIGKK